MIRKSDIILTICLVVIGVVMSLFIAFGKGGGEVLEVKCDGSLYGTYELDKDREITIKQGDYINKITIKDGGVSMDFSTCHNKDCVNMGSIAKSGEIIVCLPHKVVLKIKGGEAVYDSISR